tara:strand:+ start:842 stop:1168 length:327 start_codon:yes stop_codon:yes gene_type:complete
MSINKIYADRVGSGSGESGEIPDQPVTGLQKRGFEINALYQQANDLRIRVRQIADSVYGDEVESEDPMQEPDRRNDMVGSMNRLGSEIAQLEQMLAELRGQVSRLENL